tara:strand:+ start:3464 stop:4237 length:774 start_codon:yes stop_codon:yes gene_type:complete
MPDFSPGASSKDGYMSKYYSPSGTRSLSISRNAEVNGNTPGYGRIFDQDYIYAGVYNYAAVNFYQITRGGILFDLSSVAAGSTINSAVVKLWAYEDAQTTNPRNYDLDYYIVGNGSGGAITNTSAAINPANDVSGDWTSSSVPTYGSTSMGTGVSQNDAFETTLNAAGRTAIANAAGSTFDILIVSEYDYKDDFSLSPTLTTAFTFQGLSFYGYDTSNSSYRPVLTLDITTPAPALRKTINIVGGSMTVKGGKVILK